MRGMRILASLLMLIAVFGNLCASDDALIKQAIEQQLGQDFVAWADRATAQLVRDVKGVMRLHNPVYPVFAECDKAYCAPVQGIAHVGMLAINKLFFDSLPQQSKLFLIGHEIAHMVLGHGADQVRIEHAVAHLLESVQNDVQQKSHLMNQINALQDACDEISHQEELAADALAVKMLGRSDGAIAILELLKTRYDDDSLQQRIDAIVALS